MNRTSYLILVIVIITVSCKKEDEKHFECDFHVTDSSIISGGSVNFISLSEDYNNLFWDFGDGKTSMENRPVHTYSESGIYSVTLFAGNQNESESVTKEDYIIVVDTGSVIDVEGNKYKTVKIKDQWWMAQNLAVTMFADGTNILNAADDYIWKYSDGPKYCWYNNDEKYRVYGALYNYSTVDTLNICPDGWHIPTDLDWTILIDNLGGFDVAGGKMKNVDFNLWEEPNVGASNQSQFNALPSGRRHYNAAFYDLNEYANWWSSTKQNGDGEGFFYYLFHDSPIVGRWTQDSRKGSSIRCLKNN